MGDIFDEIAGNTDGGGDIFDQVAGVSSITAQPDTWQQRLGGVLGSVGSGATFGYADEAAAGIRSLLPGYQDYQSELDAIRGGQSQFDVNHPGASTSLDILGSLYNPTNAILPTFSKVGRLARIGGNALVGAGIGGVNAAGRSEGNLDERLSAGLEAAPTGALIGGGLSAALEGVAGGIGAFRSAREPFTNPEGVAARILTKEAGVSDAPASLWLNPQEGKTLAELDTGNIPLAELQTSMSKTPEGSAIFTEQGLAREASRQAALKGSDALVPPEVSGPGIQDIFNDVQKSIKDPATELFQSVPKDVKIDIKGAQSAIKDAIADSYGTKLSPPTAISRLTNALKATEEAALPEAGEVISAEKYQSLLSMFDGKGPKELSLGDITAIRSEALEAKRALLTAGHDKQARIAGVIAEKLDGAMIDAGESGAIDSSIHDQLSQARSLWKEYATNYESPIGKIVGSDKVAPSAVFQKILSAKAGAGQAEIIQDFDRLFKGSEQAKGLLKSAATQDLLKKVIPSGAGEISKAKITDWIAQNRNLLDYLPDLKVAAQKVADDVTSQSAIQKLATYASRGQSNTAQTLNKGNYVQSKVLQELGVPGPIARSANLGRIGGSVVGSVIGGFSGPLGAGAGAAAGYGIGAATQTAESNVVKAVSQIMAHPELYQAAASKIGPGSINPSVLDKAGTIAGNAIFSKPEKKIGTKPSPTETPQPKIGRTPAEQERYMKMTDEVQAALDAVPAKNRPYIEAIAKIESSLNPKAIGQETRYGKAKGLFGFLDMTAEDYNLKDPFEPKDAARAANEMFEDALADLGDPILSVVAHQTGLAGMKKLIKEANTTDPMELAAYAKKKGTIRSLETANYIKKVQEILKA